MKTDVLFNTPRGNSSRIFLLSFCMTLFLSGCADMPSNATVDDRTSKTSERRKSSPTPKPSTSATTSKTNGKTTDQATARTNQTEPNGKDDTSTNKKKSQAAEAAPPADAAPAVDDDPPGYYRVKEGDTLGKIAGKFNRSVSELADWNALTNPNVIEVKQMLRVAPPENAQVMRIPLESDIERIQQYQGDVIQRRNSGIDETFTVRKISNGIGVERIFPTNSPFIEKVEVNRRGKVRRARIFYLRTQIGKAARIKEKRS